MKYTLAAIAALTLAIGGPVTVAAMSDGTETPPCYEDQVMAWQGTTKQHTICIDVDDPAIRKAIADAAHR